RETDDRAWHADRWREHAKRLPLDERDELLTTLSRTWGLEIPTEPPAEYRAMTWAELKALAAQGFDIGAHTRTHPILSRIPRARLADEILGCKQELEARLGTSVRHFAYPNGKADDYTRDVLDAVREAGYEAAVTAIAGVNTPDVPLYELFRIDGGAEDL